MAYRLIAYFVHSARPTRPAYPSERVWTVPHDARASALPLKQLEIPAQGVMNQLNFIFRLLLALMGEREDATMQRR